MKKIFRSRLFIVLLLASFFIVTGFSIWAAKKKTQNLPLQIENKTQSLQVLSVTDKSIRSRSRIVELTLLNGYNKGILAFSIGLKSSSDVTGTNHGVSNVPYYAGNVLAPGETIIQQVGLSEEDSAIKILGVLFEDGTGDGNEKTVGRLKDTYTGFKEQFQSAAQMLGETKRNHSADATVQVKELQRRFADLPEESTDRTSSSSKAIGIRQAKQILLGKINGINESVETGRIANHQAGLDQFKEEVEKIATRH